MPTPHDYLRQAEQFGRELKTLRRAIKSAAEEHAAASLALANGEIEPARVDDLEEELEALKQQAWRLEAAINGAEAAATAAANADHAAILADAKAAALDDAAMVKEAKQLDVALAAAVAAAQKIQAEGQRRRAALHQAAEALVALVPEIEDPHGRSQLAAFGVAVGHLADGANVRLTAISHQLAGICQSLGIAAEISTGLGVDASVNAEQRVALDTAELAARLSGWDRETVVAAYLPAVDEEDQA
jgi:hypothetical protein